MAREERAAWADTPLGLVVIGVADPGRIRRLAFAQPAPDLPHDAELEAALAEWFRSGAWPDRYVVDPQGGAFQRQVWQAVATLGRGTTTSYAGLARAVGRPNGARAVARVVASNPVLLLVPCHRVIGSDGRLRGYAGGVERKQALLGLEGAWRG